MEADQVDNKPTVRACFLKEKNVWDGPCQPFPYAVSPVSSTAVPKPLLGLVSECFSGFTSAHPRVSRMCTSKTRVSS